MVGLVSLLKFVRFVETMYKRRQLPLVPTLTNSQPQVPSAARNLKELHSLYSLPYIVTMKSRKMRWAVHVASVGEINAYEFLFFDNRKGRDHLGPRHGCGNDIKKDVKEIGYKGVN